MCGIAGILGGPQTNGAIRLMTDALQHRGPDDVGYAELRGHANEPVGALGHRRLSILDLSQAGHQPMWSLDGRFCLIYNGEIYNFEELREELAAEGREFRGHSDTEVLLVGWEARGPGIVKALRGMFAFAIWDSLELKCHIVRDEFGIKPLYFAQSGGQLIFASEVRSILASGMVARRLDMQAVRTYLTAGYIEEPRTAVASISSLAPGAILTVEIRGSAACVGEQRRFASATIDASAGRLPNGEAPSALRNALRDSLRHHLLSDVPVGLFLSGGLDSSALVAVAAEVATEPVRTFTVTFAEATFSEAERANAIAGRFKTVHEEILLSGGDLLNAMPDVFQSMDQPTLDGVNTFVISRAIRTFGIKVVLSGLGGDELFGGYPSFRRAQAVERAWRGNTRARMAASRILARLPDLRAERLSRILASVSPAHGAYRASRTLFGQRDVDALTPGPSQDESSASLHSKGEMESLSLLQQVSQYELSGYMRNTLLRDGDAFSMAHSLEMRVPYIDKVVVRTALGLDDSMKVRPGMLKPALFEAVSDLISPDALTLPKQGFTLPFEMWMRTALRGEMESFFASSRVRSVGLSPDAARAIWSAFLCGKRGINWSRPWALYSLVRWAEENNVTAE